MCHNEYIYTWFQLTQHLIQVIIIIYLNFIHT